MLKCKITKSKRCRIRVSGTQRELTKETAMIIHGIYEGMKKKEPELASVFKNELLIILLAPDSPVWETSETKEDNHENQETH